MCCLLVFVRWACDPFFEVLNEDPRQSELLDLLLNDCQDREHEFKCWATIKDMRQYHITKAMGTMIRDLKREQNEIRSGGFCTK